MRADKGGRMIFQEKEHDKNWWVSERSIRNVPIHWHKYYELEIVLSGEGIQVINSKKINFSKGTLVLMSPQDFHHVESTDKEGGVLTILGCCFYSNILSEEISKLLRKYSPPYALELSPELEEKIISMLNDLANVINRPIPYQELVVKRKIELILLELMPIAKRYEKVGEYVSGDVENRQIQVLQPILNYINEHLDEPIRREELASMLHFSPSYLSEIFKKTLGMSLSDYITDCRMKMAHALIMNTDEPINSIVTKVGYNSPSLFYRKFYEYYRIKPGELPRNGINDDY